MVKHLATAFGIVACLVLGSTTTAGPTPTATATPTPVGIDCEPVISKISDFGRGAGALRNTSTQCGQSGGNTKSKTVTVVVQLAAGANGSCPSSETRTVTVDLTPENLIQGAAPQCSGEAQLSKVLAGGGQARFKYTCSYSQTSCAVGEGPVAKSDGGVNQENDPAFQWNVVATSCDPVNATCANVLPSDDPDPGEDTASDTAPLLCKPCRTAL